METILAAEHRQSCHALADGSQVAAVRRAAVDLCTRLGFDETAAGEVAIVVTEAATNILKHAGHGEILLRPLCQRGVHGLEILALDSGAGMANVAASLADGRSTAGSYGVGLGAMRRLAAEFDIYSAPGRGTAVMMAMWPRQLTDMTPAEAARHAPALHWGAVCLPMHGEDLSGDSWTLAHDATSATVMVADGLGHGPLAAQASELAATMVAREPALPAGTLLNDMHAALRPTRGAAAAVARIDMLDETITFAGVGNIAAHLFAGDDRRQLVSHNGIVGSNVRKVQEFGAPWADAALLILHSDGINSRWRLEDYPGLVACHPALMAGVLYRDFSRGRDDVTVLVVRDYRGWQA
ncbi:ATP-binding SpoIIE family protein phosphatase [Pseudoduganella umbonata]|uniref:Anti-sigma regulatory factor (Ser/Thr protein kinase) n=1 Tax=Pseudoduganella umbonata TaxID=864828 RepID=A0A4V1EE67_9BURK|nr:ATP-binding SpoIIE family protein phosphatase [Pseudoduganella umbonata]MBB3223616.1 anti-sigma regulatory factor (Ser/Thr protein kinase) [Pseudoduganella umbonata]QCP13521.1 serine/threonine protein kinase [Pseudoduganella umbonata]